MRRAFGTAGDDRSVGCPLYRRHLHLFCCRSYLICILLPLKNKATPHTQFRTMRSRREVRSALGHGMIVALSGKLANVLSGTLKLVASNSRGFAASQPVSEIDSYMPLFKAISTSRSSEPMFSM